MYLAAKVDFRNLKKIQVCTVQHKWCDNKSWKALLKSERFFFCFLVHFISTLNKYQTLFTFHIQKNNDKMWYLIINKFYKSLTNGPFYMEYIKAFYKRWNGMPNRKQKISSKQIINEVHYQQTIKIWPFCAFYAIMLVPKSCDKSVTQKWISNMP